MSKNHSALGQAKRRTNLAALTVLAVGAAAFFAQVEPVHAKSKRVLFASAAQCRHLTEANMETCCHALNSRFVLSRRQKATCTPLTTASIGRFTSQSAFLRKETSRHSQAEGHEGGNNRIGHSTRDDGTSGPGGAGVRSNPTGSSAIASIAGDATAASVTAHATIEPMERVAPARARAAKATEAPAAAASQAAIPPAHAAKATAVSAAPRAAVPIAAIQAPAPAAIPAAPAAARVMAAIAAAAPAALARSAATPATAPARQYGSGNTGGGTSAAAALAMAAQAAATRRRQHWQQRQQRQHR